jgi:hypothetical protein
VVVNAVLTLRVYLAAKAGIANAASPTAKSDLNKTDFMISPSENTTLSK